MNSTNPSQKFMNKGAKSWVALSRRHFVNGENKKPKPTTVILVSWSHDPNVKELLVMTNWALACIGANARRRVHGEAFWETFLEGLKAEMIKC